MRRTSKVLVLSALLVGCSSTVLEYPSVCPNNEPKCQRNLNAQTLSILGNTEAALRLLCEDPDLKDVIGYDCPS